MHSFGKMTAVSLLVLMNVMPGRAEGQGVLQGNIIPVQSGPNPAAAQAVSNLPTSVFAEAPAATPAEAAKAAEAEQKKQQRLQKIQQLTFDRRPSAILKAWATPREVALEEAGKEADNQQQPVMAQPTRVIRRVGPNAMVVQARGGVQTAGAEPAKPDPFDRELRGFQRDVTLSDWPAARAFLLRLEKEESKAAYNHLLESLASGQVGGQGMMPGQVQMMNNGMQVQMQPQQFMMERNTFANQDVISLAWVAPHGLEKERLDNLGQILRQSLDLGNAVEDFIARVRAELKKPTKEAALT